MCCRYITIEELLDELRHEVKELELETVDMHPCLRDKFIEGCSRLFKEKEQQILCRFAILERALDLAVHALNNPEIKQHFIDKAKGELQWVFNAKIVEKGNQTSRRTTLNHLNL